MSNHATKKELDYATAVDTYDLATKKGFIALKAEIDKLEINKLIMFQLVWIILKTKLDNLDVGKLKTVPADLKKLSDVVDNEVLKTENSAH